MSNRGYLSGISGLSEYQGCLQDVLFLDTEALISYIVSIQKGFLSLALSAGFSHSPIAKLRMNDELD